MIKRFFKEHLGYTFSWFSMISIILACFGIFAYVFYQGMGEISISFLFTPPNPTMNEANSGGILTPLVGTMLITLIGMLVAFPWSMAAAIYLSEYASRNRIAWLIKVGIDVLAGIPTIIIAIFALAVFTDPTFSFLSMMVPGTQKALGRSFLVSGIAMAIMVLPYVIKTCEEAIKAVPESYREASLALGATKWQTTYKVVLPAAVNGILTSITLGIGKIIGDTAIVLLTLGAALNMKVQEEWWLPQNLWETLKGTGSTLTSYIYYTSPAGEGNLREKAFGASVVLILVIILLNLITDLIGKSRIKYQEE